MTAKAQLQSAGDGTAIPVGMIGEILEVQSSNASVTTGSYAQVVSLTLTAGVWSVSGTHEMDGTASCTGISSKFYTKGVAGSVRAKDFMFLAELPAGSSAVATFLPRIVVIASTDSDKTVSLYAQSRGATSKVWGALSAIRIA
jgi:hypothetical protein